MSINGPVRGNGHDLPWNEFPAVPQSGFRCVLQSAAAENLHAHDGHALYVVIADDLGVERSGLSLELGKMKKDGLLDYHKSHFILRV